MLKGVTGITDDSRKVEKGFIFVAIKGRTVDGNNYIDEAIKNGAIKVYKGDDSRQKLGELASEFYGNPSDKLKIVGVTGTKGKTTTCHLIYHILTKLGKKVGLISSITTQGFHTTTPDVILLNKELAEMVKKNYEFAVLEVSSHGIDQGRIAGIKFHVGVLTNIAPEHLDYHKTFKEYKRVKMSFVNSAKFKVISPKETDLDILPGKFNNLNVEAAIHAVEFLGISKEEALEAVKSFKLPEGRLEEIRNDKGFRVFVDFAHTPDSLEAALKYLKSITKGRLISVFGCAGERDPNKRPIMGKIASELCDIVVLTSEDPRTEKAEDIIKQIRSGVKTNLENIHDFIDRKKAIEFALKNAKKEDTVAILGKGHEKSMNLDGIHEIPWSDREVVREYLKESKR